MSESLDFWCWLHLHCLWAHRDWRRRTVFRQNVRCRLKEMQKSNMAVSLHAEVLLLCISGRARCTVHPPKRQHHWIHLVTCSLLHELNIHIAQTSMCLLDLRSLWADAPCRGGDRRGAFNRDAGELCECACTRSQYGFHSAVGDLVLTCFVAPCRYHLHAQATQLSTTHHSRVLTCFERVDGSRNRIDWFGV